MRDLYFTLTGCNHYLGAGFLEKGMEHALKKDPDNEYDSEAIQVRMPGVGQIGFVANSTYTVKGETMSAGRLYDKIAKEAKAEVVIPIIDGAICKVTDGIVVDLTGGL